MGILGKSKAKERKSLTPNLRCLAAISTHGKGLMEVTPEQKSGEESLRRLDVSGGFLPATPAAKLFPDVMPCIPLDLIRVAEGRGGRPVLSG